MAKHPAEDPAFRALLDAARREHDFPGWLAGVLANVAAELGSVDALTEGRPGSWEADLVDKLVRGTVDPVGLDAYRHTPPDADYIHDTAEQMARMHERPRLTPDEADEMQERIRRLEGGETS